MGDQRTDLILSILRAIGAEQAAQREKLDEIISRIGALEREVATLTLRFRRNEGRLRQPVSTD